MILAAALLLLVALGLFVAGIVTGTVALYWACVAIAVVAAGVLFSVWRRLPRRQAGEPAAAAPAEATTAVRAAPPARGGPVAQPALGAGSTAAAETFRPADIAETGRPAAVEAGPASWAALQPAEPSGGELSGRRARHAAPDDEDEVPLPAHGREDPAGDTGRPAEPVDHAGTVEPARPAERVERVEPALDGSPQTSPDGEDDDPPVEDVEMTDLLLVVDLREEVLVVDEHPRYHLADCAYLVGRTAIPLPVDEARTDGFTPCALCAPDRHLAEAVRARRAAAEPDGGRPGER